MKRNIGNLDRIIRIVVGLVIIGLGVAYGSWLGIIGVVPLATAVIGWCPPYAMLGMSTCRVAEKESEG